MRAVQAKWFGGPRDGEVISVPEGTRQLRVAHANQILSTLSFDPGQSAAEVALGTVVYDIEEREEDHGDYTMKRRVIVWHE